MTRRAAGWVLAIVVALLLSAGMTGIHNEEGHFSWEQTEVAP